MARVLAILALVTLAGCGGSSASTGDGPHGPSDTSVDATPPTPAGCIDSVSPGDHVYTCGGLRVDARIPAACEAPGCGLILELHGDTGTGLLMDGHTKLRDLGDQHGYIVVAPTGPPFGGSFPGSTWHSSNDATLVDIVTQFASVYRTDAKRTHVTGFSRGGFVTWRLLCDHADLFASAAPGGAGDGSGFGEPTCFSDGRSPSRHIPFVLLMGRTDASVGYASMVQIRDAAVSEYGGVGPTPLAQDATYVHDRWTVTDSVIETFDHAYETVRGGPFGGGEFGDAKGHCIPGSTSDPQAPQYAIPCELPDSFVWGEQVMAFFMAHPMP